METLIELYNALLQVYTEQIEGMESRQSEVEKRIGRKVELIATAVLNSRMFIYDEYLTNDSYRGQCYSEKNAVMPYLLNFIAAYEKASPELKKEFESQKTKNRFQVALDELYLGRNSFITFLDGLLNELNIQERRYEQPFPPRRSNATRQMAEYREKKKEYDERIESIERCRIEIKERKQLFEKLLAEN